MSEDVRVCLECRQLNVRRGVEQQWFAYGLDGDPGQVKLEVRVPVWRCSSCAFAYTEGEAEEIRDEAVKRHLESPLPFDDEDTALARG